MSRFLLVCLLPLLALPLRAQDVPIPFPPPPTPINPLPPKDVDTRPLPPKDIDAPPRPLPPKDVIPTPIPRPLPVAPKVPVAPPQTNLTDMLFPADPGPWPTGYTAESFNQYRVYAGVDAGLWWFRKAPFAVPLATATTSAPGPGANILGLDPNVRVVLGPNQIDQDSRIGGRAWLGFWFDDARSLGVEVVGTLIQSNNERVTVQSDGSLILSRPIVMPNGVAGVYDIGYPGSVRGSLTLQNHQQLQGFEFNFVGFALGNHNMSFDFLAGARYLNLQEQIDLSYQVTNLAPMPAFGGDMLATGTRVMALDSYRATNQFYGGQLGGRLESNFGRLSLALAGKIAFGVNEATLDVSGYTARSDTKAVYGAGVLANAANVGRYRENHYAFVPEANLTAGWWLTPNVRVKVGYNVLYISDVIRPGSQISNAVNPAAVPVDQLYGTVPVTRTSPRFQHTDFLAEGISFGIDIRY